MDSTGSPEAGPVLLLSPCLLQVVDAFRFTWRTPSIFLSVIAMFMNPR